MQTIKLSGLTKFIADEIAAGRLCEDPEIRIHTGWESDEHLGARAEVVSDDGPAYVLLRQA